MIVLMLCSLDELDIYLSDRDVALYVILLIRCNFCLIMFIFCSMMNMKGKEITLFRNGQFFF